MQVKEKNNFINIIVNSVYKARNFKQRIRLCVTSKVICNHVQLRFYLRKRYNKVYLYTRILRKGFGNNKNQKDFLDDIVLLVPEITIESTQGHYTGLLLDTDNNEALVTYLKLIALLARSKDFALQKTKVYISFFNKPETSSIPIHGNITCTQFKQLKSKEIINVFSTNLISINNNVVRMHDSSNTSLSCNDNTRTKESS